MHKPYDFRMINVIVNCGVNLNPFTTKVKSEFIHMLICANSSYGEYDPSYYKDIVLERYNVSSNTKSLVIAFGSKEVSENFIWT